MEARAPRDPLEGLVAVYASHKEAGLEAIGELSKLGRLVEGIAKRARGYVILSTCNRFEVYMDSPPPDVVEEIISLYRDLGVEPRVARGLEAARRILRIASGLESRILGEEEILGQVRDAWVRARALGATTPLLDAVFHQAIVTGRKVRRETGISRGSAGYPSAAVALAASKLGGLDGARVAVVGAGKAGLSALRSLCSNHAPREVLVFTRDPARAAPEAEKACPGARVLPRSRIAGHAPFDAVIVAVDDPEGLEDLPRLARVVVDLSLPPALRGPNVYGMRDLESIVERVVSERLKWLPRAEEIVEEDLSRLASRLRSRPAGRVIAAILGYASALAEEEASKARGCPGARGLLESYAKKLLHPLIVAVREASSRGLDLDGLLSMIEELYSARLEGVTHE